MGNSPVTVYRHGKAGPKMERIRWVPHPISGVKDVDTYWSQNALWVKGQTKGVSTWASPNASMRGGKWWALPANTPFDNKLYPHDPKKVGHWYWAPNWDMPLFHYWQALRTLNGKFI